MKALNIFINILYRTFTVFIGLSLVHTYSMERNLSWKANRFSASQEICRILWKRIHNCLPPVPAGPVTTAWRVSGCGWRNGLQYGG